MYGTYTGKAFLGMEHDIEEHQISGKKILFIHTGGTPLYMTGLVHKKRFRKVIRKMLISIVIPCYYSEKTIRK